MKTLKLIGAAFALMMVLGMTLPAFAATGNGAPADGPTETSIDPPGHDLAEDVDDDLNEVEDEANEDLMDDVSEAEVETEDETNDR